jgi:hypothetical protein
MDDGVFLIVVPKKIEIPQMNYHYLDSNNQPAGPASLEEIRAFAQEGKVARNPMICPVGGSEWKLLSAVAGGAGARSMSLPFSGTLLADFVARLVKLVGGILSPALVEKSLGFARHFGQYAILLGGALGLIASIVAAIRFNSFVLFLGGVGFVIALAVAQFAAARFLHASDSLIETTPSRLSSMAFLECIGVLAVLGAVGSLVGGIVVAIQSGSVGMLIPPLLSTVVLGFFGAIALHPHLASVDAGSGSAGEEAIGILAFFLKAMLKLVPLGFALLAVVGALVLAAGIVAPSSQFYFMLSNLIPSLDVPGLGGPGLGGMGAVLLAALLPMISYFSFLVASLPIELWRAVLSLPGKLDLLRRAERTA